MLFIVATPIGNLEDITIRAINTLREVDLILAEDTRHTKILCNRYEIKTPMQSFHSHSSESKMTGILNELSSGKTMALVSDAGTPGISDPAFALITKAVKLGIKVVPIPGASAFLTALMASGAMTHHFSYFGFPPLKKGRQKFFDEIAKINHTVVIYESCHRILKTLSELALRMENRNVIVARELTKKFEEFYRGSCGEVSVRMSKTALKGEFVIVIDAVT